MTLSLLSPAKINLFLRILRKRPDGYHDLASLFQTISLFDTLHFSLSSVDTFTCNDPSLPTDQTNLVLKARELFRLKTGIISPVAIHLEKQIPQQAGLGGGSSNAATTLFALNQLYGTSIEDSKLASFGAEIGSDVSFFFSGGTAYCTGRGDELHLCPPLQKERLTQEKLTIVKPLQGLSTPDVYRALTCDLLTDRDPEKSLESCLEGSIVCYNDLEVPAFQLLPELKELKSKLESSGFSHVLMSGSGSSFFCLGEGQVPIGVASYLVSFINREVDGPWFY